MIISAGVFVVLMWLNDINAAIGTPIRDEESGC
jgi:hypothetical protein